MEDIILPNHYPFIRTILVTLIQFENTENSIHFGYLNVLVVYLSTKNNVFYPTYISTLKPLFTVTMVTTTVYNIKYNIVVTHLRKNLKFRSPYHHIKEIHACPRNSFQNF